MEDSLIEAQLFFSSYFHPPAARTENFLKTSKVLTNADMSISLNIWKRPAKQFFVSCCPPCNSSPGRALMVPQGGCKVVAGLEGGRAGGGGRLVWEAGSWQLLRCTLGEVARAHKRRGLRGVVALMEWQLPPKTRSRHLDQSLQLRRNLTGRHSSSPGTGGRV